MSLCINVSLSTVDFHLVQHRGAFIAFATRATAEASEVFCLVLASWKIGW